MSAPFDLSAVMRQVRVAFHKEGTRFVSGQDTYSVEVDATGAVDFRPRQPAGTMAASAEGSPLTLETVLVGRRDARPTPASRVETDARGGLVIHRGAVRETVRNQGNAVEQSWAFPERPSGDGPLTVRMRVRGQRFVASTQAGLHFTGGNGLGTRYGLATWVDARGVSTPLPAPRFEHGELVLQVPESLLESSTYPAVLDPLVSPESDVGKPVLGSAGYEQTAPQLAFDGTNYLAVWQDRRQNSWRIYGVRISRTGELLEPGGIALSTTSTSEKQTPAIAFNGTDYLVVWSEGSVISATRVSTAGAVLDSNGITVRTGYYTRGAPAVASDGKDFLVAWRDNNTSTTTDIFLARVSGAGKVLDTNGMSIASFAYAEAQPTVAYVNGYYLILWEQGSSTTTLWGLSIPPTLDGAQATRFPVTTGAGAKFRPTIASYGTGALAAWVDGRGGAQQQVYGVRLSPRGTRLDTADLLIGGVTAASTILDLAATFDGANVHVAWTDTSVYESGKLRVRGTRVSPEGKVLEAMAGKLLGSTALYTGLLAAASDGERMLVLWASGLSQTSDISGTLVDRDGVALDSPPRLISQAANSETQADVTFDGNNYFVVWTEMRNGESDIYGAWVDRSGHVLNPEGIRITRTGRQNDPRVAASGTDLLVVWSDYRAGRNSPDIYAARVLLDGTVLEPDGIPVATTESSFQYNLNARVASDGTDYLLIWTEQVVANAVKGRFIRGGKTGTAFTLASQGGSPTVAFQGTRYFVAWVDKNGLVGVRLERTGAVVDSVPLSISKGSGSQRDPTLATSGTGFLAVWQDTRTVAASGIYAARVTPEGNVLDPSGLLVSLQSGSYLAPKAIFDGTSYVLAWHHGNGNQRDIHGNRVTQAGAVLDGNGFVITESLEDELGGQLASDGQGNTLVVYDRLEPGVITNQVKFRFVRSLVAGQACAAANECASGFCVDGVCCDSTCGGGMTGDCQACSVATGSSVDGHCAPVGAGTLCRDSAGICDVAESCTGTSVECPGDALAEDGAACPDGTCQAGACVPPPDAGTGEIPDAGSEPDAGNPTVDAGSQPANDENAPIPSGGCGCGAPGTTDVGFLVLLTGLVFLRRAAR